MKCLLSAVVLIGIIIVSVYVGSKRTTQSGGASSSVMLYPKCNYLGTARSVPVGRHPIAEFGTMAPIMSISVPRGMSVTIMKTGGGTVTLPASQSCIYYTRYMISSITVALLRK